MSALPQLKKFKKTRDLRLPLTFSAAPRVLHAAIKCWKSAHSCHETRVRIPRSQPVLCECYALSGRVTIQSVGEVFRGESNSYDKEWLKVIWHIGM